VSSIESWGEWSAAHIDACAVESGARIAPDAHTGHAAAREMGGGRSMTVDRRPSTRGGRSTVTDPR